MKQLLDRLEDNVQQEIEHQGALLDLLDRQLQSLSEGGTEAVGQVHAALETRIRDSQARESERRQLLEELGAALDVPVSQLTLTRLARDSGTPSLAESGAQLRDLLEQVHAAHRRTTLLVRHSMQFFQDLVGALGGPAAPAVPVYDAQGRCDASRGRALMAEG